jgi:N-acylneuraminate cytidylyltransferase
MKFSKLKNEKQIVSRKHIIAIIPARGGSKSIPKKNVIDFCGKPLIAWSIEQALRSKYIEDVYVSTDDKEIARISIKHGAKVIKRPASLAKDTSSSEEALMHAVSLIEQKRKIDLIVFLQATSPLRQGDDLDKSINEFVKQKADSLFSIIKLEDFCVWEIEGEKFKSFTYDYKNRGRRQDRQPYYLENGSIYIFKPEVLKKYLNRIGGKVSVYMMDPWKSYQIDAPSDIEICEFYMRNKILNQSYNKISVGDINLIVYDFDGVMTDNRVITNKYGKEAVMVNRSDGLAVKILRDMNIPQLIISTEENQVVRLRAAKLKIAVLHGIKNKMISLVKYCRDNGYNMEKVIFIGNDLNDASVMKAVGVPVCPADAAEEIKKISRIILTVSGGKGVVRELLNYIKEVKTKEGDYGSY